MTLARMFAVQSLSRQFLVVSFPVFLIGMLVIGKWVGTLVENGVVNRIGAMTGLYVESFVSDHVQSLIHGEDLTGQDRKALEALLADTPLGKRIVSFKIWHRDGTILYATDKSLIGRKFPVHQSLATALAGDYYSAVSDLDDDENSHEAQSWPHLIETYVPLHGNGLGTVLAAAEFYQTSADLDREMRAAQLKSWLVVAATLSAIYLLLFGLVRRGSLTIERQRQELKDKVRADRGECAE